MAESPMICSVRCFFLFLFKLITTTEFYTLSLLDALPISIDANTGNDSATSGTITLSASGEIRLPRSEEHTAENQTLTNGISRHSPTVGNITVSQAAKLSADGANAKVDVSFGTTGAGTGSP